MTHKPSATQTHAYVSHVLRVLKASGIPSDAPVCRWLTEPVADPKDLEHASIRASLDTAQIGMIAPIAFAFTMIGIHRKENSDLVLKVPEGSFARPFDTQRLFGAWMRDVTGARVSLILTAEGHPPPGKQKPQPGVTQMFFVQRMQLYHTTTTGSGTTIRPLSAQVPAVGTDPHVVAQAYLDLYRHKFEPGEMIRVTNFPDGSCDYGVFRPDAAKPKVVSASGLVLP